EKLALTDDAALLLDPVLHPGHTEAPPDDGDTVRAMLRAAQSLEHAATAQSDPALSGAAARLGRVVRSLAQATALQRQRAEAMLIPGFMTTLGQLRAAMQARPVTLAELPDHLRRDWVAADGR